MPENDVFNAEHGVHAAPGMRQSKGEVALSTLERYTGSERGAFQRLIMLTNFERYVVSFAEMAGVERHEGSVWNVAHHPESGVSMIDTSVGSPTAALVMDLLHFLRPKAVLLLGMCGGLREKHAVGDFLLPIAGVRGEGTSDHFLPPQVPALSNFAIQRAVAQVLDVRRLPYHAGVIHTTNYRFWEFDEKFRADLILERVQAIDMECATLFTAGYAREVPIGALMLISDLPLRAGGVKTKKSAQGVFARFSALHIELGREVLAQVSGVPDEAMKGVF